MLKDPVCANGECAVCHLFTLFSDDSKDRTEAAWKSPEKGSQLEISGAPKVLGEC